MGSDCKMGTSQKDPCYDMLFFETRTRKQLLFAVFLMAQIWMSLMEVVSTCKSLIWPANATCRTAVQSMRGLFHLFRSRVCRANKVVSSCVFNYPELERPILEQGS